jgi:hypothetical protein
MLPFGIGFGELVIIALVGQFVNLWIQAQLSGAPVAIGDRDRWLAWWQARR